MSAPWYQSNPDETRKLRPVGKWILLRPGVPNGKSSGGIILAPTWTEPTCDGVVIQAGAAVLANHPEMVPGTRITFNWTHLEAFGRLGEWAGQPVGFLREDEIKGIVDTP